MKLAIDRWLWWWGHYISFAAKGSLQPAHNWATVGGFLFGAGAHQTGYTVRFAEGWQGALAAGMAAAATAWIGVFLIRLAIARFRIWNDGEWVNNDEFLYAQPQLAFHKRFAVADNDQIFHFRFALAPPSAYISYKTEVEWGSRLITANVGAHPKQVTNIRSWFENRVGTPGGGSMRVNKRRDLYISAHMAANATPISVRVYITGWKY